ncbi:cytochrome P450 [Flagelloscypha sp. PMI_526]|nr:cytochrome P450 [Flagelloscypha sp. PMI_526]
MFLLDNVDKQTVIVVAGIAVTTYILRFVIQFRKVATSIGNHPGWRTFYDSGAMQSIMFPGIRRITPQKSWDGTTRFGWDIHSDICVWPKPKATIHLANAAAIKEVTMNRAKWPKPLETYKVLNFYGRNIVTTEGDEWKKNRKITAPAFTDRNNRIVWDQALSNMRDLFDNVWGSQESVTYDHAVDLTMPLTLFIISAAGFGQKISFTSSEAPTNGHEMSFKEAIHHVSEHVLFRALFPTWLYRLTAKGRHVLKAFDELQRYILEMIEARRASEFKEERYDLLSGLLDANEDENKEGDGVKLTLEELTGNIFIFLIAGHETSAHTLVWAFTMLALYPEKQEMLYQHVKSLMPDGRWPAYEDMPAFTHSLAVMYETLRLFPSVATIPKSSGEDTFLMATNTVTGEQKPVPIPKGIDMVIATPGLHYNPTYWENPEEFLPERFLKPDWPREAFLPFNGGPRACLGRKFSETETVAILSVIVERYSIHIKEEPKFANETFEQKKKRLLNARQGITHT